jgi:hypothetical protein
MYSSSILLSSMGGHRVIEIPSNIGFLDGYLLSDKKQNAHSGCAPPEKASEWLVPRRSCQRWAKNYNAYPGSMVLLPTGTELLPDLLVNDATTLRVTLR